MRNYQYYFKILKNSLSDLWSEGISRIRITPERVKINNETPTVSDEIDISKLKRVYQLFEDYDINWENRDYTLLDICEIKHFWHTDNYYSLCYVFIRALCDKIVHKDIKDKTISNYMSTYNRFFNIIGLIDIRQISLKYLRRYTYKLFFIDHHSKVAFKNYKSLVNMIFGYAYKQGIIRDISKNLGSYSYYKQLYLEKVAEALKELYAAH